MKWDGKFKLTEVHEALGQIYVLPVRQMINDKKT